MHLRYQFPDRRMSTETSRTTSRVASAGCTTGKRATLQSSFAEAVRGRQTIRSKPDAVLCSAATVHQGVPGREAHSRCELSRSRGHVATAAVIAKEIFLPRWNTSRLVARVDLSRRVALVTVARAARARGCVTLARAGAGRPIADILVEADSPRTDSWGASPRSATQGLCHTRSGRDIRRLGRRRRRPLDVTDPSSRRAVALSWRISARSTSREQRGDTRHARSSRPSGPVGVTSASISRRFHLRAASGRT